MDLTLNSLVVRDDARPERDSTVSRFKLATFYLGNHGPFTERMTAEQWDAGELAARIAKLTAQLQTLGS